MVLRSRSRFLQQAKSDLEKRHAPTLELEGEVQARLRKLGTVHLINPAPACRRIRQIMKNVQSMLHATDRKVHVSSTLALRMFIVVDSHS